MRRNRGSEAVGRSAVGRDELGDLGEALGGRGAEGEDEERGERAVEAHGA